jgi:hypothetical protein
MSKTQEEIAAEAAQAAAAAAQADDKKGAEGEGQIDYKAKFEETEKELKQAQHKIVELKKDGKKDDAGGEAAGAEDLDAKIKNAVTQSLSEDRTLRASEIIDEELSKLSSNPDEQKLIKLLYSEKIVKGGMSRADIAKDLQAAKILANAPSTEAKLKETAEAAKNAPGGNAAGGQGGGQFASDSQPNGGTWSPADQELLKRYGVDPSKANK